MRFATPARYEWEGRGESTAAIVVMGLVLAIAGIVRTLESPVSQPVVAFELFVSLLVPTGLATGGYWLASHDVSSDVRWRALTRVSIGVVVACGLAVWLTAYVTLEGGTIRDPLSLTTTLSAIGGATGFVTAVRDPLDVESPTTIESSDPTESPDAAASPTTTTRSEPAIERPTAAAAAVAIPTIATDATSADGAPTAAASLPPATEPAPAPSASAETAVSADAATTPNRAASATTRSSPAIWQDVDPEGRTAAPASPESPAELEAVDDSRYAPPEPIPTRDPGVDAVAAVPSTAETVLDVLQRERARLALAVLYHEFGDEPRPVDDLAAAVADHTDADVDAVAIGLEHATLPELAAIRAVDWDPYADRVAASDHAVFEEGVREAAVLLESFEPGTR